MGAESRPLSAIVLAAGQGTRMRSERPKPLHELCGRPMVNYVLDALGGVHPSRVVVVVGHDAERVISAIVGRSASSTVTFAEQRVQRGTGDAVHVALGTYDDPNGGDDDVVVLPGDTPLLRPETLEQLVAAHRSTGAAATLLTARLDDPTGYGRIIRDRDGGVTGVVEQADATDAQRAIDEINTSMYCFNRALLATALGQVGTDNAQGEVYLTDVIGLLRDAGHRVGACVVADASEAQGVNDRVQLARAEAELRRRTNERWMQAGVTMIDPATTYLDTTVELSADVTLYPGTVLQGHTSVGERCVVGPDTRLVDTVVAPGAVVDRTAATASRVGSGARVGPFVVLGAGSVVADDAIVAPFTNLASGAPSA